MKNCTDAVQGHSHPRALSFRELRATGNEQRFDVSPRDSGLHWVCKYALKGLTVLSVHI